MSFLFVERPGDGSLHVWVGPVGVHLFWPRIWKSRPDYCGEWRPA